MQHSLPSLEARPAGQFSKPALFAASVTAAAAAAPHINPFFFDDEGHWSGGGGGGGVDDPGLALALVVVHREVLQRATDVI